MKEHHRSRVLFWAPRILCLLFAVFISLFALDVFSEHYSVGDTILALLIHLIPTAMILGILAISWRWEWASGALLIGIAVWYCVTAAGAFQTPRFARAHWDWCLTIGGPALLSGALFLIDWRYRSAHHASS
jgi:hypothetical protein